MFKENKVNHKPYCRVVIVGETCECGEENKKNENWEKRFREKFIREDGLINKYIYREDEEDLGPSTTAEAIIDFIYAELSLALKQGEEKGRAEVLNEAINFIEGNLIPIDAKNQTGIDYRHMAEVIRNYLKNLNSKQQK